MSDKLENLISKRENLEKDLLKVNGDINELLYDGSGLYTSSDKLLENLKKCPPNTPVYIEHDDRNTHHKNHIKRIHVDEFMGEADFVAAHHGCYDPESGVFIITQNY